MTHVRLSFSLNQHSNGLNSILKPKFSRQRTRERERKKREKNKRRFSAINYSKTLFSSSSSMECKQQAITGAAAVRQTALACLLVSIVMTLLIDGTSANSEAEIISTQDEILTYVNHTAKLACIIQNKNRHHVTWSRVTFINETQKLTSLLFVDLLKYSPFSRYHLTHVIERDNREYWNLEIRNIHLSDQGYYSCVLTAIKPISKIFHVKVLETARNPSFALRSTSDADTANMQRRSKEGFLASSVFLAPSILITLLTNIVLLIL